LESYDIETVSFLAPVPHPGKMVNVGLNSYDLAREMSIEIPSEGFQPIFFLKGDRNCIIGPSQKIKLSSSFVSWEVELALVIGKRARNVSAKEAIDYVAGFNCHNDITDFGSILRKDGSSDNFAGKSRETFAPLGPFLVPKEFVPNHRDLRIQCIVNGDVVQDTEADRIIWELGKCIEYLSSCVTLQPGDVIALGTGAGVGPTKGRDGAFRNFKEMMDHITQGGGRFLRSGDRVAVEISQVGQLLNEVE
jgi:2,4-diketo-3-deoxy-L-fuconate hydrolase